MAASAIVAALAMMTAGLVAATPAERAAEPPRLGLPISCQLGAHCYIQSYVDMKAGPGARDHRCGSATYDGHKGIDFRVVSAAATETGVAVIAAAPGVVKGERDGMPDQFVTPESRSLIKGRECGNGVVIDHGGGWETQYCHLKRGSVSVKPGDTVARGQRLGAVGYSGLVEFAHVHLSVRRDGAIIDPFTGASPVSGEACTSPATAASADAASAGSLWADDVRDGLAYRTSLIIDAGFAGAPVTVADLEGLRRFARAEATSPALVFFGRAMNLVAGDRLAVNVSGPGGFDVVNAGKPVDRSKARWMSFAGKRLKVQRWPAGSYVGTAEIIRDGRVVSRVSKTLRLD